MTTSSLPESYCVKCKSRTESRDVEAVTMKNGRPATLAICMACGTRNIRFGAGG